ncbi:hypothetical protein [Kitasatospora sp. NPDC091207]|uniref:hypothetical protein n=1 Tax=Kitasatospora sp. NPDC091207 TaxID=3364083 RepID=UPI0037F6711D
MSKHDISPDGHGMTVPELVDAMRTYLCPEDRVADEAETLLERGRVTRDGAGRLWITESGDAARAGLKTHAPAWRDLIHEGVDDADYATTLRVLRRMVRNVGGDPV